MALGPASTQISEEVMRKFAELEVRVNRGVMRRLTILYAAPEKPQAGLLVYADGTVWDPGSGEGVYRYSLGNTWEFLG